MKYNGYKSDASEQQYLNPIVYSKYHGAPIVNNIKENNCYISVIIHVLYNVPEIRTFFLTEKFSEHPSLELFRELKVKV